MGIQKDRKLLFPYVQIRNGLFPVSISSFQFSSRQKTKFSFEIIFFSGTPMNTKINDLKNQLKFIGIEHVDSMFEILQNKYDYDIDALMYLLRPLIIRHSQNQMYKGTKTTLMSLPPKVRVTIDLFYGCLVYA
jgi:hypothetical protein